MSFVPIPGRDANATFAGYLYQVNVTVLRWLNLAPDTTLELEAGEDIDTVRSHSDGRQPDPERVMEQLKHVAGSLTLRSGDALESIGNFCEHRRLNPGARLTFRFLTTATVGREQTPWSDQRRGIEVWEAVRSGHLTPAGRIAALETLRAFLRQLPNIAGAPDAEPTALQVVLDSSDIGVFGALVDNFEWATESGDHKVVEEEINVFLMALDPGISSKDARIQYTNLFNFVLKLLSEKGPKELTAPLLVTELAQTSVTFEDRLLGVKLRRWIETIDTMLAEHAASLVDHSSRIDSLESRTGSHPLPTFRPLDEDSPPPTERLFDYNQTLRGRRLRVQQLNGFLDDSTKRIAILPGRGGVGKTKLLRDWSRDVSGWQKLWVNPYGSWTADSPNGIPAGPALLIADDAHRYTDLDQLVDYVTRLNGGHPVKLVIATRPSGNERVDEALSHQSDEFLVTRFDELPEPGSNATLEIAEEVLGPDHQQWAEDLTRVSLDTPLITVVGGRLIARGEIQPSLLGNHAAFRKAVFTKFGEECEGLIPVGGKERKEVLQLIAAVQPVRDLDEEFADRAAAFLSLRPDQLWQGFDDLENRGILVRGKGGARIAPDLYGDFLLETASVTNHGAPNGFADEVFRRFGDTHLSNLLKNFAELDWRITQENPESRLLDNIWTSLYARFREQDAPERELFLLEVKDIAVFQPSQVQELARIAMSEEAATRRGWGGRTKTQEDVLEELVPLLGVTIYHEPTARDAFNRLWILSQHALNKIHNPARNALKKAIGYHKLKNLVFNDRILTFAEEKAMESSAYDGEFTLLNLMDELLDREVEHTSYRAGSFTFTALPVNFPAIRPLRDRALRVVDNALQSGSPRISVAAVGSLGGVLKVFVPTLRNDLTHEEQQWQDEERGRMLDLLDARITAGNLSLPLVWRINRLLKDTAKRERQTPAVRQRAEALRTTLPALEHFDLFDIICTNEYEDGVSEMGHVSIPQSRTDQEQRAFADLRQSCPEVGQQIAVIEDLSMQARDARINDQSFGNAFFELCRDRAFLEAVSEHLVNHQRSILVARANIPLSEWRRIDPSRYFHYGRLFLESSNLLLSRTVCFCVAGRPYTESPIAEDVALTMLAGERTEGHILGDVLSSIKWLVRFHAYRSIALNLYANIHIGNDKLLAKEYCNDIGPYGIPPALVDGPMAERVLNNLVDIEDLDTHAIGSLMVYVGAVAPLAIVRFYEARILKQEQERQEDGFTDYKAIPYSNSWSSLGQAREHVDYAEAITQFVALIRRFPRYEFYLAPLFWHLATFDVATQSVLDQLLHEEGDAGASLVIDLLQKAQRCFALRHPFFAMHVLAVCTDKSEDLGQRARGMLLNNSISRSSGFYAGAGPPPPDRSHISPAEALRDLWLSGSIGHTFFSDLAQAPGITFPAFQSDEFGEDAGFVAEELLGEELE
jgi:hypothetical protein